MKQTYTHSHVTNMTIYNCECGEMGRIGFGGNFLLFSFFPNKGKVISIIFWNLYFLEIRLTNTIGCCFHTRAELSLKSNSVIPNKLK